MIKFVIVMGLGAGLIFSSITHHDQIKYFQTPTISINDSVDITSSMINDSVYLIKESDTPLYYYTFLHTGVCFDNKCRPLSILIYWNITGRYLGFELPEEEFLSKYDHEPFKKAEYALLDSLLANPFLPINNYSFYDLVKAPSKDNGKIDGVSGATVQDVKDYLVPGAAYTTYKLWNLIYGSTRDAVIKTTENQLDASLFSKILHSPVSADRIWAAERIDLLSNLNNPAIDEIVEFVKVGEYSESYIALKTITPEQLQSDYLQSKLFELIGEVDYSIENQIFDKLKEAGKLSDKVISLAISELDVFNDMQIVNLLKLLTYHNIFDQKLTKEIEKLADSRNSYVKGQISKYFKEAP
ncbi:MAG: hypothetical protein ACFHWX_22725 [Bacteroidota bacterium]